MSRIRRCRADGLFRMILLSGLAFWLSSCDPYGVFDKYVTIPGGEWKAKDVIFFKVNVQDTISPHNFYLHIRNSTEYRFANLFLFIETNFPDRKFSRDTVECILAESDGKWTGRGLGKIKENTILLKSSIIFPMPGEYTFRLEQAMREESLKGIEDIGIRVERMPSY